MGTGIGDSDVRYLRNYANYFILLALFFINLLENIADDKYKK